MFNQLATRHPGNYAFELRATSWEKESGWQKTQWGQWGMITVWAAHATLGADSWSPLISPFAPLELFILHLLHAQLSGFLSFFLSFFKWARVSKLQGTLGTIYILRGLNF